MTKKICTALLLSAVALGGALIEPTGAAAGVKPGCVALYLGPVLDAGKVSGEGELVCTPNPKEFIPIAVWLQARAPGATLWTTVARSNGNGVATYTCAGTYATEYRLSQVPGHVVTINCS